MSRSFNKVADIYDSSLQPLPDNYVQLIRSRFNLGVKDHIIDLGCGSGLMTFPLSEFSSHVYGLDSSKALISLARKRDQEKRITWIHSPVEQFDFGQDKYKLIISLESFHLFPEQETLLEKIACGLENNGSFCIGWCTYHWEQSLQHIISDVFESFGIIWGEWGYQSCDYLGQLIKKNNIRLSSMKEDNEYLYISSGVNQISLYLSTIDKALSLNSEERSSLQESLFSVIKNFCNSDVIQGQSTYSIAYCSKSY